MTCTVTNIRKIYLLNCVNRKVILEYLLYWEHWIRYQIHSQKIWYFNYIIDVMCQSEWILWTLQMDELRVNVRLLIQRKLKAIENENWNKRMALIYLCSKTEDELEIAMTHHSNWLQNWILNIHQIVNAYCASSIFSVFFFFCFVSFFFLLLTWNTIMISWI